MYNSWGSPSTLAWTQVNACAFTGITCTGGIVVALTLNSKSIAGPLNPSFGSLLALAYVTFDSNGLTGAIPSTTSQLTNLQYLALGTNSITSVTPLISTLVALTYLSYGTNSVHGSLPASLSALTSLSNFYTDHNSLTGIIPPSLSTTFARCTSSNFIVNYNSAMCGPTAGFSGISTTSTNLGATCPSPPRE